MALHDSALATPHLRTLARRFICSLQSTPSYAADLALRAGEPLPIPLSAKHVDTADQAGIQSLRRVLLRR